MSTRSPADAPEVTTDPAGATVLVTAATGTVGRHVVGALADTDATVRPGSRDPSSAGGAIETGTAVEFDFARPETWGRALEGVDAVFLVRPPGVAVEELTSFVDAAARVGADRLAYLSTLGADRNPLIPHYRIERHIRGVDLAHRFLRASFFVRTSTRSTTRRSARPTRSSCPPAPVPPASSTPATSAPSAPAY